MPTNVLSAAERRELDRWVRAELARERPVGSMSDEALLREIDAIAPTATQVPALEQRLRAADLADEAAARRRDAERLARIGGLHESRLWHLAAEARRRGLEIDVPARFVEPLTLWQRDDAGHGEYRTQPRATD